MLFHLSGLTDLGLLLLRIMAGIIFAGSGWNDLKDPAGRSQSLGVSRNLTLFLGVAELCGAIGIVLGVLPGLAAIGLILIILGAIQKKAFVWKTGFWGKDNLGWNYDAIFVAILLVILFTNGGNYVLLRW
ncbi:MAG: DoxX family protein [Candidatus Baltobacteraceae bacterium]